MRNMLAVHVVVALFFGVFSISAHAQSKIYTGTSGNLALSGYDTVAYFTEGKPVIGLKVFSAKWKGAEWRFSSQKNLNYFLKNQARYAPQYGGYCAYAASAGGIAPADPRQWTVYNGKLYLNYNKYVRYDWLKDKDGYISRADQRWPNLLK